MLEELKSLIDLRILKKLSRFSAKNVKGKVDSECEGWDVVRVTR
jgi:hypothetical protein